MKALGIPFGPDLPTDLTAADGLCLFVHTDEDFNNGVWKWWDGSQWIDLNNPDRYGEATSDTPNDYQVTFSPPMNVYNEGSVLKIKFPTANTGTATLEPGTLPAREIVLPGGASLSGGELKAGGIHFLFVTDTKLQLIGGGGGSIPSGGTIGQVLKKNSSTDYDTSWQNESGGGGGTWGTITGTLTDQTDLTAYVASQTANGNTAFSWGNHALAGYLTSIPANTTLMGNTFNGADQLVKLDGSGKLPSIDGSLLTGIVAGNTFYNSDGQFSANRTVDMNGKTLTFASGGVPAVTFFTNGKMHLGNNPAPWADAFLAFNVAGSDKVFRVLNGGASGTYTLNFRGYHEFDGRGVDICQGGQYKVRIEAGIPSGTTFTLTASGIAFFNGYRILSSAGHGFYANGGYYTVVTPLADGVTSLGAYGNKNILRLFTSGSATIGAASEHTSALFLLDSTTKGFLQPRMTTTQWGMINSKAEGLQAWSNDDHGQMWFDGTDSIGYRYNRSTSKFQGFDGTNWVDLN